MMRKLQHPIALFVIAVLVVIGIAVGVVAATTNQTVYGPSWGRFTAAFPGRVQVVHSGPVTSALSNNPARYLTTVYYGNQPFNGWVGYAPFPSDLRAVTVTEVASKGPGSKAATRLVASPTGGYLSEDAVSVNRGVVNGLRTITLGPVCRYGQCSAEMVVSNGHVVWDVLASSKGPVSTVEDFLASFQPIGSMGTFPSASTESRTTATGKTIAATQFRLVLGSASSCKTVKVNPPASSPAVLWQVPNSPALRPSSPCVRLAPAQFEVSRVSSAQAVAFPLTKGDWEVNVSLTRPESVAFSRMFSADYHKEIATVIFGQVQNVETPQYKGPIDNFAILVASRKLAERIIDGAS